MSTVRTSRELSDTPEAVFAAISDPVRLARWWGPEGFTNTFHVLEFRPGGTWHFTMHGPDGTDYPNDSEFLEIIPNRLVRIKHRSQPHFELSIALEQSPSGTLISWIQEFENPKFVDSLRQFLETSNEQNIDRLMLEVSRSTQRDE